MAIYRHIDQYPPGNCRFTQFGEEVGYGAGNNSEQLAQSGNWPEL